MSAKLPDISVLRALIRTLFSLHLRHIKVKAGAWELIVPGGRELVVLKGEASAGGTHSSGQPHSQEHRGKTNQTQCVKEYKRLVGYGMA